MDLKQIKELVAFLEGVPFAEAEVQDGEVRVRLVRQAKAQAPAPAASARAAAAEGERPQGGYEVSIPEAPEAGRVIASPIVGTFYRSPAPDKSPYVEVGSLVKKGQVVCIVEAMKLMNEIESEFEGRVVQVLVNDGEAVEFGQPLMRIEP